MTWDIKASSQEVEVVDYSGVFCDQFEPNLLKHARISTVCRSHNYIY